MRITTEDGAGIDEDVKRLKGITHTVNQKVKEKNYKMSDIRLASSGQPVTAQVYSVGSSS